MSEEQHKALEELEDAIADLTGAIARLQDTPLGLVPVELYEIDNRRTKIDFLIRVLRGAQA